MGLILILQVCLLVPHSLVLETAQIQGIKQGQIHRGKSWVMCTVMEWLQLQINLELQSIYYVQEEDLVSVSQQFPAADIQEEAVVATLSTHWSIVCKLSFLGILSTFVL